MSQHQPPYLSPDELARLQGWIADRIRSFGLDPVTVLGKAALRKRKHAQGRLKSREIVNVREKLIAELSHVAVNRATGRWHFGEINPGVTLSLPNIGWLLNIDHTSVLVAMRRMQARAAAEEAQTVAKLVEERRVAM